MILNGSAFQIGDPVGHLERLNSTREPAEEERLRQCTMPLAHGEGRTASA
jgi:hypothetical protein